MEGLSVPESAITAPPTEVNTRPEQSVLWRDLGVLGETLKKITDESDPQLLDIRQRMQAGLPQRQAEIAQATDLIPEVDRQNVVHLFAAKDSNGNPKILELRVADRMDSSHRRTVIYLSERELNSEDPNYVGKPGKNVIFAFDSFSPLPPVLETEEDEEDVTEPIEPTSVKPVDYKVQQGLNIVVVEDLGNPDTGAEAYGYEENWNPFTTNTVNRIRVQPMLLPMAGKKTLVLPNFIGKTGGLDPLEEASMVLDELDASTYLGYRGKRGRDSGVIHRINLPSSTPIQTAA